MRKQAKETFIIKLVSYFLLLLLLPVAPLQAALIFHQEWEADGLTGPGFECTNQCVYSHSLTTSTNHARNGNKSLRFLVKEGDFIPGQRIRCTMDTGPGASIGEKKVLPYDTDRWFGFSVWIRSESNMTSHGICNFHAQNWGSSSCSNSESPPLGFNIWGPRKTNNGKYEWRMVSNTDHNSAGEGDLPFGTIWREDASDEMDQWVDFVFRVNFSFGDGVLQVWKNGKLVVNKPHFTLKNFVTPQHCGDIYTKISAGTVNPYMPILAYQDSHRWGDENSSYAEVDPARGGSSLPSTLALPSILAQLLLNK